MKITRRGLFGLLGAAVVAPYATPPSQLKVGTIFRGHKAALFGSHYGIPMRKLIARVRLTEEAIQDTSHGVFIDSLSEEWERVYEDISRRLDYDYRV